MTYAFGAQQMGMKASIDCDDQELEAIIELFLMRDSEFPNGTSFLISAEPGRKRRVYMSKSSYKRYLAAITEQAGKADV